MSSTYNKENPYQTVIKKRALLNKSGSSKQCFHLELEIDPEKISYVVGDSIGILPSNNPEIVKKIATHLSTSLTDTIYSSRYKTNFSLQEFLFKKANLAKVTQSFFRFLWEQAPISKKTALAPLLEPEKKNELAEFLHQHEIWDLLSFLEIKNLNANAFCDKLLPQLPRFYSIASSQLVTPNQLDLLIAEVTYTSLGHPRFGVGSHFLCKVAKEKETSIPIYVHPSNGFTLPPDDASIIMIGPGTGIAPFRAFMQERLHRKAPGKNWLFFGERNKDYDFYYEDFWIALQKQHNLQISTAFSRDQENKIYVQHRMLDQGKEIWHWINDGSYLFVCGDASKMAKDVESTLQEIATNHGNLSKEDAILFIKKLKTDKRYLTDVY